MPIIVKDSGGNFTPAPEGQWVVICCDVADLGEVETKWGKKPTVRIYWQIDTKDAKMDDGRPFLCAKQYTASLHEKSQLRKDLEAWRGRAFTGAELEGFDLEKLIGIPALIQVTHRKSDRGATFANVTSIMRLPRGMTGPLIDTEYVRWKDRQEAQQTRSSGHQGAPDDEDVDWGEPADLDSAPENDVAPF